MDHRFIRAVVSGLAERSFATLRYQFPYNGGRIEAAGPDRRSHMPRFALPWRQPPTCCQASRCWPAESRLESARPPKRRPNGRCPGHWPKAEICDLANGSTRRSESGDFLPFLALRVGTGSESDR
jgi:hypothetical protein